MTSTTDPVAAPGSVRTADRIMTGRVEHRAEVVPAREAEPADHGKGLVPHRPDPVDDGARVGISSAPAPGPGCPAPAATPPPPAPAFLRTGAARPAGRTVLRTLSRRPGHAAAGPPARRSAAPPGRSAPQLGSWRRQMHRPDAPASGVSPSAGPPESPVGPRWSMCRGSPRKLARRRPRFRRHPGPELRVTTSSAAPWPDGPAPPRPRPATTRTRRRAQAVVDLLQFAGQATGCRSERQPVILDRLPRVRHQRLGPGLLVHRDRSPSSASMRSTW